MRISNLFAASLIAASIAPTIAGAQTVDISGTAVQVSKNVGIVSNNGRISATGRLAGVGTSASISSIGAANDLRANMESTGTAVTALPRTTGLSYDLKQSASNAGPISNAGQINARTIRNGASASLNAIGAANAISTSISRK